MGGYAEIWERFVRGRRLEFGGHMDPDWSEGHALSASLMIPVEASRFRERLEPLRDALRPFPFVSLHPDHFMHITLLLLGFLVEEPEEEGEVSRERLAEIEASARRVLSDFAAFTVRLANLNAFPGAAFVEVHGGGTLDRLRDALCWSCGLKKPPRAAAPDPRLLSCARRRIGTRGVGLGHSALPGLGRRGARGRERGDDPPGPPPRVSGARDPGEDAPRKASQQVS